MMSAAWSPEVAEVWLISDTLLAFTKAEGPASIMGQTKPYHTVYEGLVTRVQIGKTRRRPENVGRFLLVAPSGVTTDP